jgi:hypothetical protein
MRVGLLAILATMLAGCEAFPSVMPLPPSSEAVAQAQPAASLFGLPVTEPRVVFALTRAGGMTDTFLDFQRRVKAAIERLPADRQFHVVFWSSGPSVEMPGGLVPATAENKTKAADFIDSVIPVGANDPSDGLRAALRARPDAVYLVGYGEFEAKIPGVIRKLNADVGAKVHVVHLVWPEMDAGAAKIMRQIAAENVGRYTAFRINELESNRPKSKSR